MIEACIAIIIDAETTKFKDYTREMYYLFPMGNIDVIQQSLYKKKRLQKSCVCRLALSPLDAVFQSNTSYKSNLFTVALKA